MDLQETLAALRGLAGETVDINVHLAGQERDGSGGVVHLSGVVDKVAPSTVGRWRLWLSGRTPGGEGFVIDSELFESAEFAMLDEPLPTYWIRQAGLVIEVMVYA